jgi:hypothetical protein
MGKQTKYTKSARNQDCQVRIPGVCNFNPETTVLAHLNGGGMGAKHLDIHGAYACSECHNAVDGNPSVADRMFSYEDLKIMHYEGVIRTQAIMVEKGILKL